MKRMTKEYISILRTNMACFELRLKKIHKTRNYILEEIKDNDAINENYKKTCKYVSYVEHLLMLTSAVTGSASISAFS